MVRSVLFGHDHVAQQRRQIRCVRRAANLVADYIQLVVRLRKTQHGLDKIVAVLAEHPRNTDDKIVIQLLLDSQFAAKLGRTVSTERAGRVIRLIEPFTCAREHVIGRDVQHFRIDLLADLRNVARTLGIYCANLVQLVLGFIYSSPRRTVNNRIRVVCGNIIMRCLCVRDVKIRQINAPVFNFACVHNLAYVISKLSAYSGN